MNLWVLFIKFMYTERILESIGYFDIFVLTQKEYWNLPGLFINCCRHKKNIGIYRVFWYICVDTDWRDG